MPEKTTKAELEARVMELEHKLAEAEHKLAETAIPSETDPRRDVAEVVQEMRANIGRSAEEIAEEAS